MAFGTFTLTGEITAYDLAPVVGFVIIDGIPQVIADPAGDSLFVGPRRVSLNKAGRFAIQLPTNSTSGNSTTIGYRVTSDFNGVGNINAVEFQARPIGSTVDLADITTMVLEPLGDTAANAIAASASAQAAATSAAQAASFGGTTDSQVAGLVTSTTSTTRHALDTIFANLGSGDVTTAQLNAAIANLLTQVPSLEEQIVACPILFPGETNPINMATTNTRELALFTAPFPLRILSVDFTFNSPVAASSSNFYLFRLEKTLATGLTEATIGTQTTATTAIVSDAHWPFTAPMDETARVLPMGAQLGLQVEVTGAPAALNGPHIATVRYARA